MRKARTEKVEKAVQQAIQLINQESLSKEEMLLFLSNLLTRVGFSMYFYYEHPDKPRPQEQLEGSAIEKIWLENPTPGSSIMKLGYDIYDVLIRKNN